jgi:hypothetical protein
MLTHGVGLQRVHPLSRQSDDEICILIDGSHKQTGVFESLYGFVGGTTVGLFELAPREDGLRFGTCPPGDDVPDCTYFLPTRRRRKVGQDRRSHFGGRPREPPRLGAVHGRIEPQASSHPDVAARCSSRSYRVRRGHVYRLALL